MKIEPSAEERQSALGYIFCAPVLKKNLLITLVVGVLLSAANQGDVLFRQPFTLGLGVKLFFNFLIPFTVSSVSCAANRGSGSPENIQR